MITQSNIRSDLDAVQAGLGLGVLSLHTLAVELMLKRLVVLDVEGFPIMRHWFIVHRQGKRFSAVAEAFLQFVQTDLIPFLAAAFVLYV